MTKFDDFLLKWDEEVVGLSSEVRLFNPDVASSLSLSQKQKFIKVFYHLRGHFHDFLWYMGNTAEKAEDKKVIVANIMEEFGGGRKSHEQLYFDFAKSFGVDIEREEIINEESHLDFAKKFNKEHIKWLVSHDWYSRVSAFAAYERLDNIDYHNLIEFAKCIGAKGDALEFFEVHTKVQHFEAAQDRMGLEEIWKTDSSLVIEAFEFIKNHQSDMWRRLSEEVLSSK